MKPSELKETLNEAISLRLKDPIILTFMISFLFVNWDIVVALLSVDKPYLDRIEFARNKLSLIHNLSWWWDYEDTGFWKYIWKIKGWHSLRIIFPAFSPWIFLVWWPGFIENFRSKAEGGRIKMENITLTALLERKDIEEEFKKRLNEKQGEADTAIGIKDGEINILKESIEGLQGSLSKKDEELGVLRKGVDDVQKLLLEKNNDLLRLKEKNEKLVIENHNLSGSVIKVKKAEKAKTTDKTIGEMVGVGPSGIRLMNAEEIGRSLERNRFLIPVKKFSEHHGIEIKVAIESYKIKILKEIEKVRIKHPVSKTLKNSYHLIQDYIESDDDAKARDAISQLVRFGQNNSEISNDEDEKESHSRMVKELEEIYRLITVAEY